MFSSSDEIKLNYSQKAIDYTLSKIKGSSNLIAEKDYLLPSSTKIFEATNAMREIHIPHELYSLEWIKTVAELAEKFAVGNCCEKTCVAFMYLSNQFANLSEKLRPSIELFNNPFLDHFFVVVGRSDLTDSADPRTWNPDTVICDPWAEGKSYAIRDVDFNAVTSKVHRVIQLLLPKGSTLGELILKKDILAKANNVDTQVILAQDVMVLRSRFDLRNNEYKIFNQNVPLCYELWDYPKEKHYLRQKMIDTLKPSK